MAEAFQGAAGFPLQRASRRLREERFDVLVIGGGIYGAWIACDAARRGLAVALVEARDWAAGTSSASSKLVHGGLRYLEQFELGLVRESLAERRRLSTIAPHHVQPLRFVLPVWTGGIVNRTKLALGLTAYDLLAGSNQPVARHRRYSANTLRHNFPWLDQAAVQGGFSYGDCQHDDARTTLSVVAAAQAAGVACANHLSAQSLLDDGEYIHGAKLHDHETDEHFEVRAKAVVAAAGPWSGAFAGNHASQIERVRGAHLILPAIPDCEQAFILSAPQDGRAFFVIPWYGRSLVGTTESSVDASALDAPDSNRATPEETRYLVEAVAARMPGLGWRQRDVIASFAGVRSLHQAKAEKLSEVSRDFKLLKPRDGLWLPLGGKFTTARLEAESVVDALVKARGGPFQACSTATTPLPGAPPGSFPQWRQDQLQSWARHLAAKTLTRDTLDSLLRRYGTRATDIADLLTDDPRLAERLHPALPFIGAEVVVAQRDEMARDLEDILRRRVPLAILASNPDNTATWRQTTAQFAGL